MGRASGRAAVVSVVLASIMVGCAPRPVPPPTIGTTTSLAPGTTLSGSTVTVVAAGDIACSPNDKDFNAGRGDAGHCQMQATAGEVLALKPLAVIPLGDEQYTAATLADFQASYDLSWGRFRTISHPVAGNHEYLTAGTAGYLSYFGTAAAPRGKTWYSVNLGSWHVIALDANCGKVGGCDPASPEGTWLAADLAASRAPCTLAVWHQPAFSSSALGGVSGSRALWQAIVRGGADLVLNGHRHQYERFTPMDAAGAADPVTGVREIVVGTGGEDLEAFGAVQPTSEVRAESFGVVELRLGPTGYTFRFLAADGTVLDHGSGTCHGKPA